MSSTARRPRVLATLGATLLATLATAGSAYAAGNAGYTTYDPQDPSVCLSGSVVNCNSYTTKESVFMGGGPTGGNGLADGKYFFAVIAPGAQNTFLSGTGLLSTDSVDKRSFTEAGGVIASYDYAGPGEHAVATGANQPNIIGLAPFADTPNQGGVYILAVCEAGATSPSQCKFDAFKVDGPGNIKAKDLTVTKDVVEAFTRKYTWDLSKSVIGATSKSAPFGTASFDYAVAATKSAAKDSNYALSGTITVSNDNSVDVAHVDVTDVLTDASGTCSVPNSVDRTVPAGGTITLTYTCTFLNDTITSKTGTNTAKASYPEQIVGNVLIEDATPRGIADYAFDDGEQGNPTVVDDCTTITDALAGLSDVTCGSKTYTYSLTFPVPNTGCQAYTNTATSVTSTTATTLTKSATVQVCRKAPVTGAHTIGFWQNKNGQSVINSNPCGAAAYLMNLDGPGTTGPYDDITNCSKLASYVSSVMGAATCGGTTCNAMLKAQELSTALSVFFANKIGATGLGSVLIDLDYVPYAGGFEDVGAAFGFASKLTVQQMLEYAASKSTATGGTAWYNQNKPTQTLAKDAFDAINNQIAYAAAP